MKISRLIGRLKEIKRDCGDLVVTHYYFTDVKEIDRLEMKNLKILTGRQTKPRYWIEEIDKIEEKGERTLSLS